MDTTIIPRHSSAPVQLWLNPFFLWRTSTCVLLLCRCRGTSGLCKHYSFSSHKKDLAPTCKYPSLKTVKSPTFSGKSYRSHPALIFPGDGFPETQKRFVLEENPSMEWQYYLMSISGETSGCIHTESDFSNHSKWTTSYPYFYLPSGVQQCKGQASCDASCRIMANTMK